MSKDIWHTPPQTPDVFKSHPIIVLYEAGDQIEQMDSTEYSDLVGERYVNRWCYVDDLLALETELERTRKALDVAVDALGYYASENSWDETNRWMFVEDGFEFARDVLAKIDKTLEQKDVK